MIDGSERWTTTHGMAPAQSHRCTVAVCVPITTLDVVASASTFAAHAPFGRVVHFGLLTASPTPGSGLERNAVYSGRGVGLPPITVRSYCGGSSPETSVEMDSVSAASR